jgi:NhaP-type Na+/H+ or K+/H+ antiporter
LEHLLLGKLALIGAVGIGAQWLAWRLHLPAVILLTLGGVLIGPVGGLVDPHADFGELLRPLVGLAVAVILFEGGLSLEREELKRVGSTVQRLLLVGVPLTGVMAAVAAHYLAGFSWPVASVVGALLVITGPTVIVPLLRQAKLDRDTAWTLKWEGILNDPLGALIAVLIFEYLVQEATSPGAFLLHSVGGVVGAAVLGAAAAYGFAWATRRGEIAEFLKAPVLTGLVAVVYAGGNWLQAEGGLIAVTVLGAGLANLGLGNLDQLRRFKEYVGVLLISGLFVVLAATLEPAMAQQIDLGLVAFVAVLLLVIRPISVSLATLGLGLDWKRRLFVGWIAPRGIVCVAVAGVFGPRLVEQGYPGAGALVPLAFLVVFVTVVLHGSSVGWLGRKLGLAAGPEHDVLIVGATAWSCALAGTLRRIGLPVTLADTNPHHLVQAEGEVATFAGEILSEQAEQRLDLARFEHVIAATDSDSYNALVASQFALEQGIDRTFQLASHPEAAPEILRPEARGRVLLGEGYDSDWLDDKLREGWRFGCLVLARGGVQRLPQQAIPVATLEPGGEVHFNAGDGTFRPGIGDTVVVFAPPELADKLEPCGRPARSRTERAQAKAKATAKAAGKAAGKAAAGKTPAADG